VKLWDLALPEVLTEWDKYDKAGTDLAGIRALALEDRYYLLVKVCRRTDALHPWIYTRCREVERDPDDRLDLWAREHYKSTLITFAGIIQEILRDPEITACIFSHTKGIARKFFRQIKHELETNEVLKQAFPDILWANPQKEAPRWAEETGLVVKRKGNPKESTLEAWGLVDGQPTSAHYKLRVYNDVVAPESVTTPDQVAKTTAAWELSDNLGAVGGRKWHEGTRYSFADTYQAILERGALKPRIYPATHDGTADGKPILLTPEQWAEKKVIQGPAVIACQMLQNPIAGQQAMFNVLDLQRYEVRPQTLNVYILVDPARSMKKGSANTAIAVIGIDAGRNKYLLDGFNHRMDLKRRWEALKLIRTAWINAPGVQMVQVGYEAYGAQADLDYFSERMEVEKDAFPIEELKWPRDGEASKDDRVQRLGPDFRSHKFYLPALILSRGKPCFWKLEPGTAGGLEFKYTPQNGLTSLMQRVTNEGSPFRVVKALWRVDSENNLYDLTRQFIEQAMLYPFAPLKDVMDAASRIYDMDPRPPVLIDESDTLPEVFADGS
jgi:ribosomal protein L40E